MKTALRATALQSFDHREIRRKEGCGITRVLTTDRNILFLAVFLFFLLMPLRSANAQFTSGNLNITFTYNGQTPSTIGSCSLSNLNLSNGSGNVGGVYTRTNCDSASQTGLATGTYTLHLQFNGSGNDFGTVANVTITGGQTTNLTVELSPFLGTISGTGELNGTVLTSCSPTYLSAYYSNSNNFGSQSVAVCNSSGGAFTMFLPAGAATGGLSASSQLVSSSVTVVAGTNTNVGTLNGQTGNLQLNFTYNGQTPSTIGNCSFSNLNLYSGSGYAGGVYTRTNCDSASQTGLAPGTYTLHLQFNGSGTDLGTVSNVTITGGQTTILTVELSPWIGTVSGIGELNGAVLASCSPTYLYAYYSNNSGLGSQNAGVCGSPGGAFTMFLPAGAATGGLSASSQLVSSSVTVVAGTNTSVGTLNGQTGNVQINFTYNGQTPSTIGTCSFSNLNLYNSSGYQGGVYTRTNCDSASQTGLATGTYSLHLQFNSSGNDLLVTPSFTISSGQTANVSVELNGVLGTITGTATINGSTPQSCILGGTYTYAYGNNTAGEGGESSCFNSAGDFVLLLPAGPGTGGIYQASLLGSFSFNIIAGTNVVLGQVLGQTQTITFNSIANQSLSTGSITVSPTASSGLSVAVNSNTPSICSASGYSINLLTTGTCSLTATQLGNSTYQAATPVTQTFSITQLVSPTTTAVTSSSNTITYGQSVQFTVAVSPSGAPGTAQFAIDGANFGSPVTVSGGSAVSGSTASLSAGNHTVTAVFTSSSNGYGNSSGTLSGGETVSQATPTVNWSQPAAITYGSALGAQQLNATASVPGTFVYTPAAGTVLAVGNQSLSASFTPTDAVDYKTVSASTTIAVNAAPPSGTPVNIVPTRSLVRSGGNILVTWMLANTGGTTATNVTVTALKIGSTSATGLPVSVGTIPAGGSAEVTIAVPGSAGTSGAASTISLSGTYTGGTFSSSGRLTLP